MDISKKKKMFVCWFFISVARNDVGLVYPGNEYDVAHT